MAQDYNRYSYLKKDDGTMASMPFVPIPERSSDKFEYWNTTRSRLEKIAFKYYGNPFYDFLILYANPEYISGFDIPDGALIRIPFPLTQAKADYEAKLQQIINQ